MNRVLPCSVVLVVLTAALVGCGLSETVVVTGIVGQNAKNQIEALNNVKFHAKPEIAENNVRRAINLFEASTGSLPYSLDELVEKGYLEVMPALPEGYEFNYDPFTGTIKTRRAQLQPQIRTPQLPPARDSQNSSQYMQTYEQPPQTPVYSAPTQSGRRAPQRQGRPARSRMGGGGGSGVGPMGEMMTGIGMQKQLNSMSGAGTSSAGSYSRRSLGTKTQQYNQRQAQALKNLGY